jgi:hypothetical protein
MENVPTTLSLSSYRSAPGFPASQCQQRPRMRLFLKESRTEYFNATILDRKCGGAYAVGPLKPAAGIEPKMRLLKLRGRHSLLQKEVAIPQRIGPGRDH